jgi:hypothetical protein
LRLGDLRHSTSNDEFDAIEAFMWLIRTAFAGNDAASARNLSAGLGYRKQLDGVGLDQV